MHVFLKTLSANVFSLSIDDVMVWLRIRMVSFLLSLLYSSLTRKIVDMLSHDILWNFFNLLNYQLS